MASVHESAAARFANTERRRNFSFRRRGRRSRFRSVWTTSWTRRALVVRQRVRLACVTIQVQGLAWPPRVRRKGFARRARLPRGRVPKVRFRSVGRNGVASVAPMITAMCYKKRVWSRRADTFKAWRHRTHNAKRFYKSRAACARRAGQAPPGAGVRGVARRRRGTRAPTKSGRRVASKGARGRSLRRALARWSGGCARARARAS